MRKIISTMLIAGLMAAGPALAEEAGEHGKHWQKWAEKLELSDTQRAELKQLHHAHMPQMREQRQKMRELRATERGLDPTADDFVARSRELAEERARIQVEAATTRAEHRQQMARILTPEQRQQIEQARDKQRKKMHGGHHGGDKARRGEGPKRKDDKHRHGRD